MNMYIRINGNSTFGGIMFVVIGIVFIIVAIIVGDSEDEFRENAITTTAYVERVDAEVVTEPHRSNGKNKTRIRTEYIAYVTYDVDGITYSNIPIKNGARKFSGGQTITIYYNSENPVQISTSLPDGGPVRIIFIGVGVFATAFGGYTLYKRYKA